MIDILMATHDGERFVREQIESVRAQTCEDWRLLVSDDCSTDGTLAVVREMAEADPRIAIVSEGVRYGSAKANFMHLLGLSEAPYAMFCDQDDVWLPDKIELSLGRMRELEGEFGAETPLLVFADMKVVDGRLDVLSESFERMQNLGPGCAKYPNALAQAFGAGCTFLMNEKLVRMAANCADVGKVIMHDWWVAAVATAFGRVGHVDGAVSLYRQHGGNSVGARRYSVLSWAGRADEMRDRQLCVAEQASCFAETFERELPQDKLDMARKCAATCGDDAVRNLLNLIGSGAWKSGARKFGQVCAAIKGGGYCRDRSL